MVTAVLQAWAFRQVVAPDSISYLDIARACVRGSWHSLVNGYWSPLYPMFVSFVFRVVRPSPYWEFTTAHFANVVVFAFSFACFEFLIGALLRNREFWGITREREPLAAWAFWLIGDSLFVFYTLLFNSVSEIGPDLLLAGLLYLAAGFLVRIRGGARWGTYAMFGAALGTAYLAKEVMFPLSFVALGCAFLAVKPVGKSAARTLLAFVSFAVVAALLAGSLSVEKRRITFGDTGKIAYAEFVDGAARYINWQGGPDGVGRPVHPTREVLSQPPLFVFAGPVGGTYPPWYDPSYWYEGVVPVFKLKDQLRAIRYTIEEYAGILPYLAPLLVTFLAFVFFGHGEGASSRDDLLSQWPLWVIAAAGLGTYALVYVEARLVAPFLELLSVALFAGLTFSKNDAARAIQRSASLALAVFLLAGIGWLAFRASFRALAPKPFVDWQVAEGLKRSGIDRGDQIASMGYSLNAYWAHLAGLRIVAEIPWGAASAYWACSPGVKSEILTDFANAGAKAVVTDQGPPNGPNKEWQRIGQTAYFIHMLSATSADNKSDQ